MDNPCAAPESVIAAMPVQDSEAEKIRRGCLSHEASVKSISTLYSFGAIILLPGIPTDHRRHAAPALLDQRG
jgi:hypothetical protein